jgi:hypothetical protein
VNIEIKKPINPRSQKDSHMTPSVIPTIPAIALVVPSAVPVVTGTAQTVPPAALASSPRNQKPTPHPKKKLVVAANRSDF